MRIDKDKLKRLSSLNDDALWEEIRAVGSAHGFKLPEKPPKGCELDKIRGALSSGDKINLGEAIRIINQCRKGK